MNTWTDIWAAVEQNAELVLAGSMLILLLFILLLVNMGRKYPVPTNTVEQADFQQMADHIRRALDNATTILDKYRQSMDQRDELLAAKDQEIADYRAFVAELRDDLHQLPDVPEALHAKLRRAEQLSPTGLFARRQRWFDLNVLIWGILLGILCCLLGGALYYWEVV